MSRAKPDFLDRLFLAVLKLVLTLVIAVIVSWMIPVLSPWPTDIAFWPRVGGLWLLRELYHFVTIKFDDYGGVSND